MTNLKSSSQQGISASRAALVASLVMIVVVFASQLPAQTLTVLHNFTGGHDGATPLAGLSMDASGALYGTAEKGGAGNGTVFKLAHVNGGWIFTPLYAFGGGSDGADPVARVVFGPQNILYGTTEYGGTSGYCEGPVPGCGTVFALRPFPTTCRSSSCPWLETVVRRFSDGGDFPQSEVVFDSAGNLYGSAYDGGALNPGGGNGCWPDCGVIYKLTPSNGSWTESVIYLFTGYQYGDDGANPIGGLTFDSAGNLYGTASTYGNCGFGIAFQLTPNGANWNEHRITDFCGAGYGGALPAASMIKDASGNLYGTTMGNYAGYGTQHGSVYEMTYSNGNWTVDNLYTFPQYGGGPAGQLLMDGAGNLYGTTVTGGINPNGTCSADGCGLIFKLTPSNGSWTYSILYEFTGGSDGAAPYSNLLMDSSGNFYGTASAGGASGDGVVFQFTP